MISSSDNALENKQKNDGRDSIVPLRCNENSPDLIFKSVQQHDWHTRGSAPRSRRTYHLLLTTETNRNRTTENRTRLLLFLMPTPMHSPRQATSSRRQGMGVPHGHDKSLIYCCTTRLSPVRSIGSHPPCLAGKARRRSSHATIRVFFCFVCT